jgi:uncharacterized protein (DUF1684 family)
MKDFFMKQRLQIFNTAITLLIWMQVGTLPAAAQVQAYEQEVENWHQKRVVALKAENGWLNLAGLFWLKPGTNTLGPGTHADIPLPGIDGKPSLGAIDWQGKQVTVHFAQNAGATIGQQPVQSAILYHADSGHAPTVALGALRFTIIKRGDKLGVRMRHLQHEAVLHFKGIDRFAVDTAWRIEARFIPALPFSTIAITNVLGQTIPQPTPGSLVFEKNGIVHSLQALEENGKLFIVFGDQSNAVTTYGAGRFLYADKPEPGGTTVLDFNKAINPPCAFTPFATCPLPPLQNRLAITIVAGEKDYSHLH